MVAVGFKRQSQSTESRAWNTMEYFHPCIAKAQDQAEPNRRSDNFAREWEVNSYSVESVLCGHAAKGRTLAIFKFIIVPNLLLRMPFSIS